jgi:hypothetical protein
MTKRWEITIFLKRNRNSEYINFIERYEKVPRFREFCDLRSYAKKWEL